VCNERECRIRVAIATPYDDDDDGTDNDSCTGCVCVCVCASVGWCRDRSDSATIPRGILWSVARTCRPTTLDLHVSRCHAYVLLSLSLIEYDNKQQHNDILVRSAFQAWQVIVSASHSTPAIFGASLAPALCKLPVLPPLCKPPRAPTPAPPRPRKAMLWYNNERNQQRCCVCKGTNNDNDNDERERRRGKQTTTATKHNNEKSSNPEQ
jgi:hypothetical protein